MPKTPVRRAAPPQRSDDPFQKIMVPRESGTHADILAAVGLAELLTEAAHDHDVTLRSQGAAVAICLSQPRRPSELVGITADPGYRYLQSKSAVPAPAGVTNPLDYQATRDQIAELRRQESELHAKRTLTKDPAEKQQYTEAIDALREHWPIPPEQWRRYAPYLMLQGHETANKLLTALVKLPGEKYREIVQGALAALAAGQPSGVSWAVSTVQLFSPNAAKGYARLKPDSTGRGDKTKDAWADPFIEWLRYRGYFAACIPVFHGSKGEHIRLLVPVPEEITVRAYRQLVERLPTPMRGASPPKIDSLTTLSIARLLVEHSEVHQNASGDDDDEDDDLVMPSGSTPSQVISGLAVTNYQSLGNARAVSLMTELAVPGWFPINTPQDATDWLAILEEHRAIVRSLEDTHSDELSLLLAYRRFLEQRGLSALSALLDFAGAYGNHVFRVRDTGRRIRQFSTELLGRVIEAMEPKYRQILDNEGFKAVAAAIRRSTVAAQSLKANGRDHRDIRYGLLPDLRRAREMSNDDPLMVTVAEFIASYNAENARRQESSHRPWHARVTTDEFAEFASLVDQFHAGVVGALLCAYGTCTERREPSGDTAVVEASDESGTGDDQPEGDGVSDEGDEE